MERRKEKLAKKDLNEELFGKLNSFCTKNKISIMGLFENGSDFVLCENNFERLRLIELARRKLIEEKKLNEYLAEVRLRETLESNGNLSLIEQNKRIPSYAN